LVLKNFTSVACINKRFQAICAPGFWSTFIVAVVVSLLSLIAIRSADAGTGSNNEIEVAATVDDLPGMGALPAGSNRIEIARAIIHALIETRTPAYGFANGVQLDADPPEVGVLKDWANAGFPVGNHTFSHPNLGKVDARNYVADIQRMDQRLAGLDLSGGSLISRRLFRYPYLAEGNTLEKRDAVRHYLFSDRYRIAEVTVDFHDWAWNDAYTRCLARNDTASLDEVRKRSLDSAIRHLNESIGLARMLFGRDIRHILLTHMGAFEAAEMSVILERYRAAGVKFITLERAMADPIYGLNPNYAYMGTDQSFLEQTAASRRLRDPLRDTIYTPEKIAAICQ
jgi:peptidoglycan/xylan/chitin deacetylase (PgdA/CDA1 family)